MGRTCSTANLTEFDSKVIELCKRISEEVKRLLPVEHQKSFHDEYGKISFTRDAGAGIGGGKLQRDAITSRGRTAKAPYSNRNLRWHPLVVCTNPVNFARTVESVNISEEGKLVFVVKLPDGSTGEYDSDQVYELPTRYAITSEKWESIKNELRKWKDADWAKNLCVIPSLEACEWYDSVETYALLAVSVACGLYNGEFNVVYAKVVELLRNQTIDTEVKLPSAKFPTEREDIVCDPITKIQINQNLDNFRSSARPAVWNPNWRQEKRNEGNDDSIQLMHLNPLIETEIRHTASNVRYGFRWSNVAMTDHSINETIAFFKYIVERSK